MTRKFGTKMLRRINVLSSIRGKITFLLLSLTMMAGTAGYFNYQSFDLVSKSVRQMTEHDLPQLEQSNALIGAASKTKNAMISVLIAGDSRALQQAAKENQSAAADLEAVIGTLPEELRVTFSDELGLVLETLETSVNARANSFESTDRVNALTQDLQNTIADMQSSLLETADNAYFNISVKGDDTITTIEDTLLDLVENKFATLQSLLEIRAEINFLSGITLAMASASDRSTLSIFGDLATSSYDRLQTTLAILSDTDIGASIGEDLFATSASMSDAINAGQQGKPVNQASVLASRQQADAVLSAAVDDMVFELTIAADDTATGNRDAIQSLLDNEVAFMNTLLEINSQLSAFQIEALKILATQSVEQAEIAGKALFATAQALESYSSFNDGALIDQIDRLSAIAELETGLASFRAKSIQANTNAAEAVRETVKAVLLIAGEASVQGMATQGKISEKASVLASDATLVKQKLEYLGWAAGAIVLCALVLTHLLIVRPLNAISLTTERLSQGDMSPVEGFDRSSDEIARIARALTVFRDGLVEKEELAHLAEQERAENNRRQEMAVTAIGNGLSKLADGDLTYRIEAELSDGYQKLKDDFNSTADTLNRTVVEVTNAADSIRNGSSEIGQAADDLAKRTESQAATLEQTASALEQLTMNVRTAAEGTKDAETTTLDASKEASESGEIVESAVQAMRDIETSSSQISQIIGVIDDIAFQTNLLALNAGVEAARAGEAGHGFAVVASEVRGLSLRTTDAANEIKELISKSSNQVEVGVDLVGQTGVALRSIVDRVSSISTLVSEISASTNEQATALAETNEAVSHLDKVTQQNAAMVEETSAAGQMLREDSQRLGELMDHFDVLAQADEFFEQPDEFYDQAKAS